MRGGVLITGGSGFIGARVHEALAAAGERVHSSLSLPPLRADFELPDAAGALVRDLRPRAVIHAGALTNVADCEENPARARRVNVDATAEIASAARSVGARLIFLSTDQVWAGDAAPYRGDEPPLPRHAYGRSKAEAEGLVLEAGVPAVVLRLALVFGRSPSGRRSASEMILRAVEEDRELGLFEDEWRQPVSVGQVSATLQRLVDHELEGVFALAGPEALTRLDFGRRVAKVLGLSPRRLRPTRAADLDLKPPRPRDLRADGERLAARLGLAMPPIDEELRREHDGAARA